MLDLADRLGQNLGRGQDATPADVLRLALRLLRRGGWTPDTPARNAKGEPVAVLSREAWSFSCSGSIGRACHELGATWVTGMRAAALFSRCVGAPPIQGRIDFRQWERAAGRDGPEIDAAFLSAIFSADHAPSIKGALLDATA